MMYDLVIFAIRITLGAHLLLVYVAMVFALLRSQRAVMQKIVGVLVPLAPLFLLWNSRKRTLVVAWLIAVGAYVMLQLT